jgi:hypothetical protein
MKILGIKPNFILYEFDMEYIEYFIDMKEGMENGHDIIAIGKLNSMVGERLSYGSIMISIFEDHYDPLETFCSVRRVLPSMSNGSFIFIITPSDYEYESGSLRFIMEKMGELGLEMTKKIPFKRPYIIVDKKYHRNEKTHVNYSILLYRYKPIENKIIPQPFTKVYVRKDEVNYCWSCLESKVRILEKTEVFCEIMTTLLLRVLYYHQTDRMLILGANDALKWFGDKPLNFANQLCVYNDFKKGNTMEDSKWDRMSQFVQEMRGVRDFDFVLLMWPDKSFRKDIFRKIKDLVAGRGSLMIIYLSDYVFYGRSKEYLTMNEGDNKYLDIEGRSVKGCECVYEITPIDDLEVTMDYGFQIGKESLLEVCGNWSIETDSDMVFFLRNMYYKIFDRDSTMMGIVEMFEQQSIKYESVDME